MTLSPFLLSTSTVCAALFTASFAMAGDLEGGVAAYRAGDFARAEQLLRPLAEQGSPSAQYWMGEGCAGWKWPGSKQSGCSFQWFTKAAAQGDVESQSELGELYLRGSSEPLNAPLSKDPAQALSRLTWAAERGSASAQLRLADYYGADIAADGHLKDSPQSREAYYWTLIAAQTLRAHPEVTADPLVAQYANSLPMVTEAYRGQISENNALIAELTAFHFAPRPDRHYPAVKIETAPAPSSPDGFKAPWKKLSDESDYFARTSPQGVPPADKLKRK
jgi:hypothetical protein